MRLIHFLLIPLVSCLLLGGCGMSRHTGRSPELSDVGKKESVAGDGTRGYIHPNDEGQQAQPLRLQTEAGQGYALYDIEAEHTILFFYDPACPRCGAVTEALHAMYQEYKHIGIEVYAVYTGTDRFAWVDWLSRGGYTDWVNVWDAEAQGQIGLAYQLPELPVIYLLNKEKKVEVRELSFSDLYVIVTKIMARESGKN